MPQIFLSTRSIQDPMVTPRFPLAAVRWPRRSRELSGGWSITAAKATIDSSAPIDLGCIRRNDAQGKRGGTDPQYLMGE
jgi:hypothetical protein